MNAALTYCQTGCVTRGAHLDADNHPDDCKGCSPRPTDRGTLCSWCWQRLVRDVSAAPELVHHLREIGQPHAQVAPPSDHKTYRDPAEGDIIPAEWQAADEIHANLASWVLLILEEHPNGPQMVGPEQAGAWVTKYGTVAGVRTAEATAALVTWLTPWLEWVAAQEWAATMLAEVGQLVNTTAHRWPTAGMVEREHPIPMPCPRCDHMSLTYTPPSDVGVPFRVGCTNDDCARVWSEDEWEWLVNMVTKGEKVKA